MWDAHEIQSTPPRETQRFFDWMESRRENEEITRQSRDAILRAEGRITSLTLLRQTPQSSPYHSEGMTVIDHIERMLVGLFGIVGGARLVDVEEFARERHLRAELEELESVIREQAATLEAFCLLHDLAKAQTVSLDAPDGSRGAAEGFTKDSKLSEKEKAARYLKLIRAYGAEHEIEGYDLTTKFYGEYGIRVHYYNHEREVLEDRYDDDRLAVENLLRLTSRDQQILSLLIRHHNEALMAYPKGPNPKAYKLMMSRANKAGLDADDVMDLQLAALFLDNVAGSLPYYDGRFSPDTHAVIHMLESERAVAPHRLERREERMAEADRKAFKRLLKESKLEAEQIFRELDVAFGPERGKIMDEVHALVKDPDRPVDEQRFSPAITSNIQRARTLYQSSKRG